MRVFLDANVLVAAALSRKGGSFRVITEAKLHDVTLLVSRYVVREAELNVHRGYPHHLDDLVRLVPLALYVEDISEEEVERLSRYINKKDAPVLGAALAAGADVLLTLDRRDFISNKTVTKMFPNLEFLAPGDFIHKFFT